MSVDGNTYQYQPINHDAPIDMEIQQSNNERMEFQPMILIDATHNNLPQQLLEIETTWNPNHDVD